MIQTDFIVGQDNFADLLISPTSHENFFYFFNQRRNHLIKRFVLDERPQVSYFCEVTLIKKTAKFTPRLHFMVKNKTGKLATVRAKKTEETVDLKASVNLKDCHECFWQLISFLRSLREIEIPDERFSLVSKEEGEIVAAIRKRDTHSIINIIKQLSTTENVSLSGNDLNELLKRRERLKAFKSALVAHNAEPWWQQFFLCALCVLCGEPSSRRLLFLATSHSLSRRSFSGGGPLATNSNHSRTTGNCCPTSRTRFNIYHYITYPCRHADNFVSATDHCK